MPRSLYSNRLQLSVHTALALLFSSSCCYFFFLPACPAAESLWLDAARASITKNELHNHVSVLADDMLEGREGGSRGGRAAARYLVQKLQEARLRPAGNGDQFTQNFQHNHQNLLAIWPSSDPDLQDEYVLVGAHYDHVGYGSRRNSYGPWGYIHNGADDNASGVAAVLEVIDALVQTGHQPRRSILFAFWDGEEQGLLGSKYWKRNPTIPLSSVGLAINVDMVGRLTNGRIEVGGTRSAVSSRNFMCSSSLPEGVWLDFNWEYKNNSDHWTFFHAGIPSLYVHTGVHDDYHRPSDDVEKLNIDGIRIVSDYLLQQLSQLTDVKKLPTFRRTAISETPATQRRLEQSLPALSLRLDFAWQLNTSPANSILITHVPWRSPATQLGLSAGDQIVAVNGQPVIGEAAFQRMLLRSESPLNVQVVKQSTGEQLDLSLPLVGKPTRLGLSWRADQAEPKSVYVTRVVPHSPAALAGIKLHDRIYEVDGKAIVGASELLTQIQASLDSGQPAIDCLIESKGRLQHVQISLTGEASPQPDATL